MLQKIAGFLSGLGADVDEAKVVIDIESYEHINL